MKPTKEALQKFADDIHGSGIDADWHVEEARDSFRMINGFHAMDENGMYDGWADFTIIFPKKHDMIQFKLQFNGKTAQYLNQKYMLRSYLEDMFAGYINEKGWDK